MQAFGKYFSSAKGSILLLHSNEDIACAILSLHGILHSLLM